MKRELKVFTIFLVRQGLYLENNWSGERYRRVYINDIKYILPEKRRGEIKHLFSINIRTRRKE